MPRMICAAVRKVEKDYLPGAAHLWEGLCPAPGCPEQFQIEADAGQPKWDVLRAFNAIRPEGNHLHGSFWVVEHHERGGE